MDLLVGGLFLLSVISTAFFLLLAIGDVNG